MAISSEPGPDGLPEPGLGLPEPPRSARFPEPVIFGAIPPLLGSDPCELPAERFAVADTVLNGAGLPGLAIRGAALRGDEHRHYGITRQDSIGIWKVADSDTEAVLVCVADGVGSEPLSQHGSAQACGLLRDEVQREVTPLLTADAQQELPSVCVNMVQRIAARLMDVARYLRVDPKVLSTTLAGALVEAGSESESESEPKRERRYTVFGVGDSGAFLLSDGTFLPLFRDEHDTVIMSTETSALPTSPGVPSVATGTMKPGDVLMVCTDGLSNPMRTPEVTDQLARWWSQDVPSLPEFGWQLSFRLKTHGDDRSAVCVWGA